ncbi:protein of unknown function [Methylocaldum szegediense]|uniref:Uncharacterized protein n=1 Tax=Methylocaldum szegediense TaxID=73780 RepID=A0ABN8X3A6_9GAMM|nr:protein of unknown function [Methylocaldum szegediense]
MAVFFRTGRFPRLGQEAHYSLDRGYLAAIDRVPDRPLIAANAPGHDAATIGCFYVCTFTMHRRIARWV